MNVRWWGWEWIQKLREKGFPAVVIRTLLLWLFTPTNGSEPSPDYGIHKVVLIIFLYSPTYV